MTRFFGPDCLSKYNNSSIAQKFNTTTENTGWTETSSCVVRVTAASETMVVNCQHFKKFPGKNEVKNTVGMVASAELSTVLIVHNIGESQVGN